MDHQGDFAFAAIDNSILHTLFHHFIFLFSHGPFSLLRDEAYDAQFKRAATALQAQDEGAALHVLERYARDHALVLFTIHEHVHAAFRSGFSCELPRSGYFQVASLLTIRASGAHAPACTLPPAPA